MKNGRCNMARNECSYKTPEERRELGRREGIYQDDIREAILKRE